MSLHSPFMPAAFDVQCMDYLNWEEQQLHRKHNHKLCTALDMTKLGIELDSLVKDGLDKRLAEIFFTQAQALLAALLSENNRLALERARKATV